MLGWLVDVEVKPDAAADMSCAYEATCKKVSIQFPLLNQAWTSIYKSYPTVTFQQLPFKLAT